MFYAVVPYFIWVAGRHLFSDYHTLLISTAPGFAYTIWRFAVERSWNVTGIFLVIALIIGTTIDLLSGNAEMMIRNNIRTLFAFGLFFLGTMIVNRPMALYFFADTAYMLGIVEKRSVTSYRQRELMPYFHALTMLFVLRYTVIASAKSVMFTRFGVDGYGLLIWWRVGLSWGFGLIILLASFSIAQKVRNALGS